MSFDDCIPHKFIYAGYATVNFYGQNRKLSLYPLRIHFINLKFDLTFFKFFTVKKLVYSPKVKYPFDDGVLHKLIYEGGMYLSARFISQICWFPSFQRLWL